MTATKANVRLRQAQPAEAETVARLHAASWRSAYAHFFDPAFLDGPIEDERIAFWTARLRDIAPPWTMVAEVDGKIVGFACVELDRDGGALLDNLHVLPEMTGAGLGRQLLGAAAQYVAAANPRSNLHLWVYEENVKAHGFYEKMGGRRSERQVKTGRDGHDVALLCYKWEQPFSFSLD